MIFTSVILHREATTQGTVKQPEIQTLNTSNQCFESE